MRSPLMRWAARVALFVVGLTAPAVCYALRVSQTQNAETAIEGLLWGFAGTLAASVAFAFTFKSDGIGRLAGVGIFLVAVLLTWIGAMTLMSWFHA